MSHLPALVTDLALILVMAGIITLLFKKMKQPLVLGYIVVGIIAGPYIDLLPSVSDKTGISTWADIGVIFLLFALGLEFNIKKLVNVGASAFITAFTEVISMLTIGFIFGKIVGWGNVESLFLGGMLSMSSTTIIIKAFDDLNVKGQKFAGLVFGTLVVEDIVAILMMVLLPTIAVSQQFDGMEMIESFFKLGFFMVLWFLVGIFILPSFFKRIRNLITDEMLLIISLGLCLGMVVFAVSVGFSAALGAFMMGSILSETIEGARIEHLIKGLKDFFGAVFFVSVGMLVDPNILLEHWGTILLITLVVLVFKPIFSGMGVLLSGQNLKIAVQSGMSLAQIGEFAFIIASVGVSMNVISPQIYPIIVAVSVITTFTTPYFIRLAEPLYNKIQKDAPKNILDKIDKISQGTRLLNKETDWKSLLKKTMGRDIIYSVIMLTIHVVVFNFISPLLIKIVPEQWVKIISGLIALVAMAPFLRVMLLNKGNVELFQKLWNQNHFNKGGLICLVLFQSGLALFFICTVLAKMFSMSQRLEILVAFAVFVSIALSRHLLRGYNKIERRFVNNLNVKEEDEENNSLKHSFETKLIDRNIHLAEIKMPVNSHFIGKTLLDTGIKQQYGVIVVKIVRGSMEIDIPEADEIVYPQDVLVVLGNDEQIYAFSSALEVENKNVQNMPKSEITLESIFIEEQSYLCGKSIQQSGLKDSVHCLVIGIERGGKSVMNPHYTMTFEAGDLVWIVGNRQQLYDFMTLHSHRLSKNIKIE
ncbi:MAG: cation:proton antiporter [Bacteroidales bacterium]|nr:cation:proton antiporter [Bacteroidales bacterium]MCR4800554.1 cation:proton antiporter [Bacteroidales bacterium]